MAATVKPGDRVSFSFMGKEGTGECILSSTSTHALVAVDNDFAQKTDGPHRFTIWCELAALVILPPQPKEK